MYSPQLNMKRHFTNSLVVPVKHSKLPQDLWQGATVCDRTYMVMRASIQIEDSYELIFHSICNFCVYLPQIKQLHCTALHVYAS